MTVLRNGEIVLYGMVGDDFWEPGFYAAEVLEALAQLGHSADITVRINSGGGYTDEGVAIYNALAAHGGTVAVKVDAIAASAASLIAMAGDTITMRTGSQMMIHDPATFTFGTEADHEKAQEGLSRTANLMAGIYAAQCGESEEAVRADMRDEIWLTPTEAVERGYATDAENAASKSVAAFDYRIYANAPQQLVAMARTEGWNFKSAASAARNRQKETPMPPTTPPAAVAGATAPAVPAPIAATAPDQTPAPAPAPVAAVPPAVPVEPAFADMNAAQLQARNVAILTSESGRANPTLAEHLAYQTQMSSLDALAALAASVSSAPASPTPQTAQTPPAPAPSIAAAYQAARSAAQGMAQPVGATSASPRRQVKTPTEIYADRKARRRGVN